MSMKKILMAAVAVSALTAGAASAATISAALVSGWDTQPAATTPTPYKLANETVFPASGTTYLPTSTTPGANLQTLSVGAGRVGVGTYTVTYTLSGPASYQAALSNGSLTVTAGALCIAARGSAGNRARRHFPQPPRLVSAAASAPRPIRLFGRGGGERIDGGNSRWSSRAVPAEPPPFAARHRCRGRDRAAGGGGSARRCRLSRVPLLPSAGANGFSSRPGAPAGS